MRQVGAVERPLPEIEPAVVAADPRVLADPAPTVLLDRFATEKALEVVVGFSTAEDVVALVKSDLIKALRAAPGANRDKCIAASI